MGSSAEQHLFEIGQPTFLPLEDPRVLSHLGGKMFTSIMAVSAQGSAVDQIGGFFDRLFSDPYRFGVFALAFLVFGFIAKSFVGKFTFFPAGLGAGWLAWEIFNAVQDSSTDFFVGDPSPWGLILWAGSGGIPFILGCVSAAAGIVSFMSSEGNGPGGDTMQFLGKSLTGISVFFGMLLLSWQFILPLINWVIVTF